MQRAIAMLRVNPSLAGSVTDRGLGTTNAYVEVRRLSANATLLRVFLYTDSTIPAAERVIDPIKLASESTPTGSPGIPDAPMLEPVSSDVRISDIRI